MNFSQWDSQQYLILGYAVGIIALWGYAALLWMEAGSLRRRERDELISEAPHAAHHEE